MYIEFMSWNVLRGKISKAFYASHGAHGAIAKARRAFLSDRRGSTIVVVALALPALIGAMGLAAEVSYWRSHRRAMQNAADASVIAAATNGGSNYVAEGQAVAAQYGFTDGAANIRVAITAPSTAAGCSAKLARGIQNVLARPMILTNESSR